MDISLRSLASRSDTASRVTAVITPPFQQLNPQGTSLVASGLYRVDRRGGSRCRADGSHGHMGSPPLTCVGASGMRCRQGPTTAELGEEDAHTGQGVNRGEQEDRRLDADAVAERPGCQPGEWHGAVVDHRVVVTTRPIRCAGT